MRKIIFSIITIILLAGMIYAYTNSNAQVIGSSLSTESESFCQQGSDFIVQIAPFGCSPAVVRSDLLEENNVPVYCQIIATKINPLINVKSIDSISFSGKYSPQVSGIAFYPAKAALSGESTNTGLANSNNIGYVKIMLKKQSNESSMPNFVTGNLTAKIKYDIDTAFGIGDGTYYLPEFSSASQWEENKNKYSFWNGKGYLQADSIDENSADISVYSTTGKISTVSLEEGKTSNSIYLPGFECQAGLKVTLQDIQNPDTKARLRINSDTIEVGKGEKFLDNKCSVESVLPKGIIQTVTIKCKEDSGTRSFSLAIDPKIKVNIGGEDKTLSLGDEMYSFSNSDKKIYLGYIGQTDNGTIFIVPVISPAQTSEKFKSSFLFKQLPSLIETVKLLEKSSSGKIINNLYLTTYGGAALLADSIITGDYPMGIYGKKGESIYPSFDFASVFSKVIDLKLVGKMPKISSVNFGETANMDLSNDAFEYYTSAKTDYEEIQSSFPSEVTGEITYGEEALYNEIVLSSEAGQRMTTYDLCKKFESDYPNSKVGISIYCNEKSISNSETQETYVTINKQTVKLSFEGTYEPTLEEYSALVSVENAGDYSGSRILSKNQRIYVSETESFYLSSLENDRVILDVSGIGGTVNSDLINGGKLTIDLSDSVTFGKKKYKITVNEINLKKVAKVSLKSNIDNTGTEANFSFKIGIEKRAAILTPSVVKDKISDLSKNIESEEKISAGLDKINQGLKTACLATGAALVVKNFLLGTSGEGTARKQVMSGKGGWSSICAEKVAAQEYVSLDQCYLDKSDEIDKDVSDYTRLMQAQNDEIKKIESGAMTSDTFGTKVVNTDKFMTGSNGYIETAKKNINIDSEISDPSGNGDPINTEDLMDKIITSEGYEGKAYSIDQLKEIELYSKIANDPSVSAEMKEMANQNLYSVFSDIQSNANAYQIASSFNEELKQNGLSSVGSTDSYGNTKSIIGSYSGGTVKGDTFEGLEAGKTYPAKSITYNNKKYILVLQQSSGAYTINKVYNGDTLDPVSKDEENMIKGVFSSFATGTSYKNGYKNPELSYYETEPYSGLPAIVPFDKTNGWYASISQTLPTGNNIASYSTSGKVTSFWVCNVGSNGLEENKGGDDICEMINTGTGQPYNQFPGLSDAEATKIINNANKAIEQASNAYSSSKSGTVKVLGENVKVGKPAANIPDFQCQDFMSPKDCNLLFNLCDPVICPASRCDLGGEYPVKDVIQTGIVGSLLLCLPNAREGILMPVCLTGVQAGIDNLISVQESYRDCLNESLTTGKMVGICDEIYSLYLCDFLWRQAVPLAGMIVPAIATIISGENVRGGGEYMNVASSWGAAEQSVNYLVNYYGSNAKSAFTARSSELVSDEVCKMYASATVPTGADFFDTLIASDSPPQYTARFDEIPLTTATASATSQYKVYFHIYAGKDSGVYYKVYLKGSSDSSYYKDTSQSLAVDSGYVTVGNQVDKTNDIIGASGYKQLCINIDGEEECGFAQVSTSFLSDFVTDQYLASTANETAIKKTSDCISGTANMYSLLVNLNAQAAAQSLINPAIYNQGIIRVCATADPGAGTDSYSGTEDARWKAVGYCDTQNIKCWIDTESIKEVIKSTYLENSTIGSLSDYYEDILSNEYDYLTEEEFDSALTDIKKEKDPSERIGIIDKIIEKVFLNNEKANLLLLRGNAYEELLKVLLKTSATTPSAEDTEAGTSSGTSSEGSDQTSTDSGLTTAEKSALDSIRQKILTAADNAIETDSSKAKNCFDAVEKIYTAAGAKVSLCIYSDNDEKTYNVGKESMTTSSAGPFMIYGSWCTNHDKSQTVKLGYLQSGDMISYTWTYEDGELAPHNAIFIKWEDSNKRLAKLFDWNGAVLKGEKTSKGQTCGTDIPTSRKRDGKDYCKVYRYYTADLSDTTHPVYVIFPASSTGTAPSDLPAPTDSDNQELSLFTTSTSTSSEPATLIEKILAHAKAYADADSTADSLSMVISSLKAAEITISAATLSSLASTLKDSSNFYEVDVNTELQKGDIVLISKDCQMDYAVGIVKNLTLGKHDSVLGTVNYVNVYTNTGGKVEIKSYLVYEGTPNYQLLDSTPFKAYRYGNGVDTASVSPWTITSALNYINQNNLNGNYNSNKEFINQLIFDRVLTQSECDTVKGTGLFALQKDIIWLKTLLLSKQTSTSSTQAVGEKIYLHAQKYVDASSTISSTELVINSLKAAGITGISASDPLSLASTLKNNPSLFYEVDITKTQKEGDIIILGKICEVPYSVGILYPSEDSASTSIKLYTNLVGEIVIQSFYISSIISSSVYPYKSYRYVGDLSDTEKEAIIQKTSFTVTSALQSIQDNNLKGSYSDNKVFMSKLVFDEVLTDKECETMNGGLSSEKDITWLKTLLLSKQTSTSSTDTSSTQTVGEKTYLHAQKYVDSSSTISSAELVINSLKAAGVTGLSASNPLSLASTLKNNPSLFYEVDITKTQKDGDIVFIGDSCSVSYAVGILGALSSENSPSKNVKVYTNVGNKVTLQNIAVSQEILSGNYVYKSYRYIGDLSDEEISKIEVTRTPWTISTALNIIDTNKLKGSYSDNKIFMSQLVFDRVLTESECDTMDGNLLLFGLGQKDITWLKSLLLSKKASEVSGGAH
jgi:hypothetical protein